MSLHWHMVSLSGSCPSRSHERGSQLLARRGDCYPEVDHEVKQEVKQEFKQEVKQEFKQEVIRR